VSRDLTATQPKDKHMTNKPLNVSFDNGFGALGNKWNAGSAQNGEVTLKGNSAMMEWASGKDAGHGYGTYTVTAKVEGNQPGPAIILWPGNDKWPGQEMNMMEITPDGSGRQYGTVHWNNNGKDAFDTQIFTGVKSGVFHDYQLIWAPDQITFKVDGVEKGSVDHHVPTDFDHGGINNTIGVLNNNANTSITVSHIQFTPLGETVQPTPAPAPTPSPVETPAPVVSAPAPASGAVDWAAIAAQVTAHYEATGVWAMPSTTSHPAEPTPAPAPSAPEAVDWNALAAQVNANFAATGHWFI
jgi:hypothetical protein